MWDLRWLQSQQFHQSHPYREEAAYSEVRIKQLCAVSSWFGYNHEGPVGWWVTHVWLSILWLFDHCRWSALKQSIRRKKKPVPQANEQIVSELDTTPGYYSPPGRIYWNQMYFSQLLFMLQRKKHVLPYWFCKILQRLNSLQECLCIQPFMSEFLTKIILCWEIMDYC